ncbi:MAG TPA: hypothetical protein VFH95_14840 [Candidatus Kapabacteria bacterium]|nr:hypothetical protein [Candidatus Kapabacteria bacterium]
MKQYGGCPFLLAAAMMLAAHGILHAQGVCSGDSLLLSASPGFAHFAIQPPPSAG